jgi:hypothetical protein
VNGVLDTDAGELVVGELVVGELVAVVGELVAVVGDLVVGGARAGDFLSFGLLVKR